MNASTAGRSNIFVPGTNCWRRERADRIAFLVDAASYFEAVADAIQQARHQVFLLGWDFHSRVPLRRDGKDRDWPDDLVGLLDAAVRRNRRLHVYLLEWDYYMVYAREREFLSAVRFGSRTHRRVHFHFDDQYPTGASHHQKIVVVDDAVAFSGGIDLTANRWDTSEHLRDDPRRVEPGFPPYDPYHDIQMAVDGPAAAALGELARERWKRAGKRPPRPVRASHDPWPPGLAPDLEDAEVVIARTEPCFEDRPEVREVEQSYLDAIAAAHGSIYIENQYVTSHRVRDALVRRLGEEDGPEVVIVTPRRCAGWLEHQTMGAMRAAFLAELKEADRFDRLRAYYPTYRGGPAVFVHSKCMIADDRTLRIGSANLANRSMGLDTECDLLIESGPKESVARAIGRFRDRLLGEHLGVDAARVGEETSRRGSLIAAVEALRGGEKTLEPIETDASGAQEEPVAVALLDPERPVGFDELRAMMGVAVPSREGIAAAGPPLAVATALVGLAAVWSWTPVSQWIQPQTLIELATPLRTGLSGPAIWIVFCIVAALAMAPLTALVVASAALFGPLAGAAISLGSALVSGVGGFLLGRWVWHDAARRLAGRRWKRIDRAIGRRGVLSIVAVRMVPIAPYTMVNMVAGASSVRLRDFVVGTAIGLLPGILGLSLLSSQAIAAMTEPGERSWGLLALIALGFVTAMWLLRRFLGEPDPGREPEEADPAGPADPVDPAGPGRQAA